MHADRLRESSLSLLWSVWTELGVPGPFRHHAHLVADPERLVVATPALTREDARLQDLAWSWCAQHAHRLCVTRLATVLREAPAPVRVEAEAFLGELVAAGVRLARVPGRPAPRARSSRELTVPVDRPALLRLRARGLVGLGARADLLVALLASPATWVRASQLDDVGVAKRNVVRMLAELTEAGIVVLRKRGNAHEHRLTHPRALAELIGGSPEVTQPPWRALFQWLHLIDGLTALPADRPTERRIAIARGRPALVAAAAELGAPAPPPEAGDPAPFLDWIEATTGRLAAGRQVLPLAAEPPTFW